MSTHDYRLIILAWVGLILFLGIFWVATLRHLAVILAQRLRDTRSRQTLSGFRSLVRFLLYAEYKDSADSRLIAICHRLRTLLFAYFACIAAFLIFASFIRPRY